MDELSGRAQKLIADAMAEDDPPAEVAETGWSVIASRLSQEEPRTEPTPTRQPFPRWLLLPTAIALAAAVAWIVTHIRGDDEPATVPGRHAMRAVDRPAPGDPPRADPSPEREADANEGALIEQAESALADGDAERALEVLDRHAMLHPTGERADDRLVLRVRALCALDRGGEAKAEVEGVRRLRPDAPALSRLHDTCVATRADREH